MTHTKTFFLEKMAHFRQVSRTFLLKLPDLENGFYIVSKSFCGCVIWMESSLFHFMVNTLFKMVNFFVFSGCQILENFNFKWIARFCIRFQKKGDNIFFIFMFCLQQDLTKSSYGWPPIQLHHKTKKKNRWIGVPVPKPWCESLKWVQLSASVQQTYRQEDAKVFVSWNGQSTLLHHVTCKTMMMSTWRAEVWYIVGRRIICVL